MGIFFNRPCDSIGKDASENVLFLWLPKISSEPCSEQAVKKEICIAETLSNGVAPKDLLSKEFFLMLILAAHFEFKSSNHSYTHYLLCCFSILTWLLFFQFRSQTLVSNQRKTAFQLGMLLDKAGTKWHLMSMKCPIQTLQNLQPKNLVIFLYSMFEIGFRQKFSGMP